MSLLGLELSLTDWHWTVKKLNHEQHSEKIYKNDRLHKNDFKLVCKQKMMFHTMNTLLRESAVKCVSSCGKINGLGQAQLWSQDPERKTTDNK